MRSLVLTFCFLIITVALSAQNLQYDGALIVGNTVMTVPAGKVWKVTGAYGEEFRVNECVDMDETSTHELARFRCAWQANGYWMRASYAITSFMVNGASIVSTVNGFRDGASYTRYSNSSCTGSSYTYTLQAACANKDADPNIFPMWLPAGTTVMSGGPNTYISVLQFDETP